MCHGSNASRKDRPVVIVDSTVWVDYFNGQQTPDTDWLELQLDRQRLGLTTIISNPGSTEVPFLAGLPEDLRFVIALHEGSVVGMAAGYALG